MSRRPFGLLVLLGFALLGGALVGTPFVGALENLRDTEITAACDCPTCRWSAHPGDVTFEPLVDEFSAWNAASQSPEFGISEDDFSGSPQHVHDNSCWGWTPIPAGLIYRSYLAGPREPRFGTVFFDEKSSGTLWDTTLGARFGLLRYGTFDEFRPQGVQLDFEGAAFPRLDPDENLDLHSVDFRVGMPLTWSAGDWRWKFAYYHISAHMGDEFLVNQPVLIRRNYVRDALVVGGSYFPVPSLRLYGEFGWAFHRLGGADPWELQFGAELAPARPSAFHGDPFVAVNGYLRQELNFGGTLTAQAGWQWRSGDAGRLLRVGIQYFQGHSVQFEFFPEHEEQIGVGLWYDF